MPTAPSARVRGVLLGLPLFAGLFAVMAVTTAPAVESSLTDRVRAELESAGFDKTEVEANGRSVLVRAVLSPDEQARVRQLAQVRGVRNVRVDAIDDPPSPATLEATPTTARPTTSPTTATTATPPTTAAPPTTPPTAAPAPTTISPTEDTPDQSVGPESLGAPQSRTAIDAASALLVAEPLEFPSGYFTLFPRSLPTVDALASLLAGVDDVVIEVQGHTDSFGTDLVNQRMSQARADSVRAALIERGLAPERLVAVGYGSAQPVADDNTQEGRAANRRVAVVARP